MKVFPPSSDPSTELMPVMASQFVRPEQVVPLTTTVPALRSATIGWVAAEKSAALLVPVALNVKPGVPSVTKVVLPLARPSKTSMPQKGSVTEPSDASPAGGEPDTQAAGVIVSGAVEGVSAKLRVSPGLPLPTNVSPTVPAKKVVPPFEPWKVVGALPKLVKV